MNGRNASRGSFDCGGAAGSSVPNGNANQYLLVWNGSAWVAARPVVDDTGRIVVDDSGRIVFSE